MGAESSHRMPMPLPDYQGASLVNLMSSILQGLGGESAYAPLGLLPPQRLHAPTNVVLLVIDGLGYDTLTRHGAGGALHRHLAGRMTSVFPSTTASAVTTFLTGEAPAAHGLTGWHMYFKELAGVLAVLPGVPRAGGVSYRQAGIDAAALLDARPAFDRIPVRSYVISPKHIAGSEFNLAHQGRAEQRVFATLEEMFAVTARTLRAHAARKYLYVYWPELDRLGHERGIGHPETLEHLAHIDRAFAGFLREAAGTDTLVLVTADHGHIDTTPESTLELADHPELADCLLLPLCGERRAPYCYVRAHRAADFEAYVREALGAAAELHRSLDLIEAGWFGPGPRHPRLHERVGDYVLVMKENYVLKDWLAQERRYSQVGVHGGVSAEEMYVPLIVAEV